MILDPLMNNQAALVDLSIKSFNGRLPSIWKTWGFRFNKLWELSVHLLYVLTLRIEIKEVEYSLEYVLEKE